MRIIAGQGAVTRSTAPALQPPRGRPATWSASRCSISSASWSSTASSSTSSRVPALGLEALSRGAERAIFVERDRENVSLIIRNIATLRYEDRAQVKLSDVYRWVRIFQPPDDRPVAVFLDPPYREYEAHSSRLNQMISHLVDHLPAGSVIALEAGRILDESILPDLPSWDIRRYGETRIAIKVTSPAVQERARQIARRARLDLTIQTQSRSPRKYQMSETPPSREFALEVVSRLRQAGYQSLWAGARFATFCSAKRRQTMTSPRRRLLKKSWPRCRIER